MNVRECVFKLSWEGFAALCRDLAERVAADYEPDLVVGIARAGTLPGALIALLLRRDFHPLRVPVSSLPLNLPTYLPDRELIAGRRVLLVDERAPDDAALRWAVEALRRLGAGEIRTALLFAARHTTADYTGPEVDILVIQPWIQDTVLPSPAKATSADLPAAQSGHRTPAAPVREATGTSPCRDMEVGTMGDVRSAQRSLITGAGLTIGLVVAAFTLLRIWLH